MRLFLDTTNSGICIAVFDQSFRLLGSKIIPALKEKSEKLPAIFEELIDSLNLSVFDIKHFFLCIGPGSFTGSRVGVIFIRSIAQITKAKISTINSFELLSLSYQKDCGDFFIKISSSSALRGKVENFKLVEVETHNKFSENQICDYNYILENFDYIYKAFEQHQNPLEIEVFYGAQPQIGTQK